MVRWDNSMHDLGETTPGDATAEQVRVQQGSGFAVLTQAVCGAVVPNIGEAPRNETLSW